jgi:nucleotide-binding universal stress UspA family protein
MGPSSTLWRRKVFERILLPMEHERHQEPAIAYARKLAQRTGAAVVLAWIVPVVATEEAFFKQIQVEPGSSGARRKATGEAYLEEAASGLQEVGADVTPVVKVTALAPEQAILELAAEHEADLILMATLPQSAVGRFLLGSVAEKVRRRSPIPVLFVQAPEMVATMR